MEKSVSLLYDDCRHAGRGANRLLKTATHFSTGAKMNITTTTQTSSSTQSPLPKFALLFGFLTRRNLSCNGAGAMSHARVSMLVISICFSFFTQSAAAGLAFWLNPDGGYYESPSNWSGFSFPAPEDDVILGVASDNYDIDFISDRTAASLRVTPAGVPALGIGGFHSTDQTYNITGAVSITPDAHLKIKGGLGATLQVDVNDLDIAGKLSVVAGAKLNSPIFDLGDGEITLSGVGHNGGPSEFIVTEDDAQLGYFGTSTVQVTDGARFSTPHGAKVGLFNGGHATITIDGKDEFGNPSLWDAGKGLITQNGRIIVTGGGQLSTGTLIMDDSLRVDNGAHLSSRNADIGTSTDGLVQIAGGPDPEVVTTWTNSNLVRLTGQGATSAIRMSGYARAEIGKLEIYGNGLVRVGEESVLAAETLRHTFGGSLILEGTLDVGVFEGDFQNFEGTLSPGGPHAGSTSIFGDYLQRRNANLAIDIGGTSAGVTYDAASAGSILLDGDLDLTLIDGFVPAATDVFGVLRSSNLAGTFQNVLNGERLETVDGRGSFQVNYGIGSLFDSSKVVLSDFLSISSLLGDFDNNGLLDAMDIDLLSAAVGGTDVSFDLNSDGLVTSEDRTVWVEDLSGTFFGDADLNQSVDFADFLALSASFGEQAGWAGGDFDGSGDVAFADFLMLSSNFGNTASSNVSAVPEPATLPMILFGLLGFAGFRRRR